MPEIEILRVKMTAKALITEEELLRMAKVAKDLGVKIEVVTYDGLKISVSPFSFPEPSPNSEK